MGIKRNKDEIEVIAADSITVGKEVWAYGKWLIVTKVNLLNQHPYLFKEIHFAEFKRPVLVPAGWKIETRKLRGEQL